MSWGGERFSYTLKVKTKKPWRPVTSGRETAFTEDGDSYTAESHGDHASRHIAVLGGKYVTREETIDGLVVRVHAYAMARKNVIENLPKLTAALVKFYTGMLGAMPAEELDVVEIPEYGFGISPSGIVLLTSEAYKAREDDVAQYLSRGINARLAHEVAHQWFGHKAWQADRSEQWIGESFAEYFSGLAMASLAANDKTVVGFNQMLAQWRADASICSDVAPISMANSLGGESGRKERRCLLYSRGPLVLHMLRTSIGNDRFFAATKKFLDTANTGPATTDDYAKAVSDVVQMDMRWYFDQWVRSTGYAQVDVEQHVDPSAGGQYKLWGAVRQKPGGGFKKLLVPLVWESGGKSEARVVFADEPEKKFEFMLPAKPGSIKPDPFQNNLAVYK
jgi:aminopeptidase N